MLGSQKSDNLIVDLFCGCGGFSLGAELAGFETAIAIDVEPNLQSSFRLNFPKSSPIQASVSDIQSSDWRRLLGRNRPAGVIGGPPCQGFSWIGQRSDSDPRNNLLSEFYRQVSLLRPKFFIMENVDGLIHKDKIHFLNSALETVRDQYVVLDPILINARDFGAPTNRKRVMIVGYDPTEMSPMNASHFIPLGKKASVADAIRDLPSPVDVNDERCFGWGSYPHEQTHLLSNYARMMRQPPPLGLGSRLALDNLAVGRVSGLANTIHSERIAKRYHDLQPGKADPISKSVKLSWDGFCPTLRAGTGPEKGSYQAVRPLHPDYGRVITVREAARLQGFPDWFLFHTTKWHSFRMIGNSVSPIVSRAILSMIAEKMSLPLAA